MAALPLIICSFLLGCQFPTKRDLLQVEAKNKIYRAKIVATNRAKIKIPEKAKSDVVKFESQIPQNKKLFLLKTQESPKLTQSYSVSNDHTIEPIIESSKKEMPSTPSFMAFLKGPAKVNKDMIVPSVRIPPPATSDTIRVALLLPLSGPNEELGQSMLNAAQLAVFDFADLRFELLIHDTKGSPQGAEIAAETAISDGAGLIIGPLLAKSVEAAAIAARAANVPILAFSNDQKVAGKGVFIFGFLPSAQVERVVKYANLKGIKRFAVLAPKNNYGENIVASLSNVTLQIGAIVSKIQYYDQFTSDFSHVVKILADYESRRKALINQRIVLENEGGELAEKALKRLSGVQTIGELPFEALLVADGGNRLKSIAALLPFYGIDPEKVKILGTGQWDESGIGKEPALVGAWFAAPSPDSRAQFEIQYRKMYGKAPPRLVTLAYDASALGAILAREESSSNFALDKLISANGFVGRDGIFRLMPNGTTDRGLAILEVGVVKNRVISVAPKAFKALVN